jgi:urease accessory protein
MSDRLHIRDQKSAAAVTRESHARLKIWLSPSFPAGAYAYSHGLEKAVENGWVRDSETLREWLLDLVQTGSLSNDLIFVVCSWRATREANWQALQDIAALSLAMQPSRERELEAVQQGTSFLQQIETAWPYDGDNWDVVTGQITATYPVAVGYATARHGAALDDVLDTYGNAFISSLASASIRLSIIGQTDAQRVLAALLPQLIAASKRAVAATLDDLGGATWLSDLASLQHETQGTRLFRS